MTGQGTDPRAFRPTDAGAAFRGATRSGQRLPLALAALAIAVVGLALLSRLTHQAPAATTAPSPAAAASAAPGSTPAVAVSEVEPTGPPPRNPGASPLPAVAPVDLPAGRTVLEPFGATAVRLEADVPAGWARAGDGMLVKAGGHGPTGASISVWTVARVNAYPCRWSSRRVEDQDLSTPDGLATALASWWGQDPTRLPYWNSPIAPLATRPVGTAFLERPAFRLEVLIPSTLDLTTCDGGELFLWEAADGTARVGVATGELHRLWVVDLADGPVVVDASSFRSTPERDLEELEAILGSLTVAP